MRACGQAGNACRGDPWGAHDQSVGWRVESRRGLVSCANQPQQPGGQGRSHTSGTAPFAGVAWASCARSGWGAGHRCPPAHPRRYGSAAALCTLQNMALRLGSRLAMKRTPALHIHMLHRPACTVHGACMQRYTHVTCDHGAIGRCPACGGRSCRQARMGRRVRLPGHLLHASVHVGRCMGGACWAVHGRCSAGTRGADCRASPKWPAAPSSTARNRSHARIRTKLAQHPAAAQATPTCHRTSPPSPPAPAAPVKPLTQLPWLRQQLLLPSWWCPTPTSPPPPRELCVLSQCRRNGVAGAPGSGCKRNLETLTAIVVQRNTLPPACAECVWAFSFAEKKNLEMAPVPFETGSAKAESRV